ncbi:MAG: DUF4012 domain-containing protein [Actinobacteria bacterium]|nr:DUF4012 domain-containing protein [Actinomycetota bacterium]
MPRPLRLRSIARAIAVICVLLIAWVGWQVWQVKSDLEAAKSAASVVRDAVDARDLETARAAVQDLGVRSNDARERTDGMTWSALTHLPVFGDDAHAVRVLSDVLDDLAAQVADPLLDIAYDLDNGAMSPQRGRIPIEEIGRIQTPVEAGRSAVARSEQAVAGLSGSYVQQIDDARQQVSEALETAAGPLRRLATATRLLPSVLGGDGPRRYLLVLQNNAEIRSTGGFPGSAFLLKVDDGLVQLTHPEAGQAFPHLDTPALPLSSAERTLFSERAGTWFVDANTIPSFARSADLWTAHWERRFGGRLDGVVATDPVTLSYVLEATGPVEVDGVELTHENATAELLSGTYARLTDPEAQDAFFRRAGSKIFGAVTHVDDAAGLLRALQRSADEQRLLFSSVHPDEEREVTRTALAGVDRPAPADVPRVGVFVSDTTGTTGSKLSYYLRYQAKVVSTGCGRGRQELTGTAALQLKTPEAPDDLPLYVTGGDPAVPVGDEDLYILLVGPKAGSLNDVRQDGRPVRSRVVDYEGRPATRVELRLPAGGATELTWRMVASAEQTGDVQVDVTPSVVPGSTSSVAVSSCR